MTMQYLCEKLYPWSLIPFYVFLAKRLRASSTQILINYYIRMNSSNILLKYDLVPIFSECNFYTK